MVVTSYTPKEGLWYSILERVQSKFYYYVPERKGGEKGGGVPHSN